MKTLIIIPAYNEAENIIDVISNLHNAYPNYDLLVVNDGSSDNTSELAHSTNKASVIDLPFNIGIGGCVQTGFKYAEQNAYEIALQFDGDGQHMIHEIEKLVDPIIKAEADCVIGSRFIQSSQTYKPNNYRMLGIYILRVFSFLYIGQKIADQTSGFRAYNKKCIHFLSENYPGEYPEPEVIVLLGKNNFNIKELFTQMRERQGGISSIPLWKGPYYIIRVLLSMSMAAIRSKSILNKKS